MEKLITNLQQTYCTRNSYYMMSIINQFREKAPDLCINYLMIIIHHSLLCLPNTRKEQKGKDRGVGGGRGRGWRCATKKYRYC